MLTQLFLEGLEVDLTDVINIPLNKTFEDLQSPSDINNDFSKEIKIQVNSKNNEVLGNAFRIDRTIIQNEGNKNIGKYLNPTKKINFRLLNNGDLIMEGYAKLSLADYSSNNKYYTINLFGTLGDIFHKLLNVTPLPKFCPELDARTEVYNEKTGEFYPYAVPFNMVTDDIITETISPNKREDYRWRDIRYLIENKDIKSPMDDTGIYTERNFISGNKYINAKSIKECWENDTDDSIEGHDITKHRGENLYDWQIVGFMPSHHGFPDNFDAKAVENYNPSKNITASLLFADIAKENTKDYDDDGKVDNASGYSVDTYIGDGLTEEQFQQFVSWQQKPYIYVSKLFQLFQKHMENNPDLFNGYKLELDNIWLAETEGGKILNPYWVNLIYTFDFLFNQKLEETIFGATATHNGEVLYKHTSFSDGYHSHDVVELKTKLNLNKSNDDIIKDVTLNSYACVLVPVVMTELGEDIPNVLSTRKSRDVDSPYILDETNYYGTLNSYLVTTNSGVFNPTWFFSTGFQKYSNSDRFAINGNYIVHINVIDKDSGEVINTYKNVWYNDNNTHNNDLKQSSRPIYAYNDASKIIGMFGADVPEDDRLVINRLPIIPVMDKNGNWVAPSDFAYRDNMIWSWQDKDGKECPIYYFEIMLPLRSFGTIPIGIKSPEFEVRVELDSHNCWSSTKESNYEFGLGSITSASRNNNGKGEMIRRIFKVKDNPLFAYGDNINLKADRNHICTDMCFRGYSPAKERTGKYFDNVRVLLTNSVYGTSLYTVDMINVVSRSLYSTDDYANKIIGINYTLADDTFSTNFEKATSETEFYRGNFVCTCETSTSHNFRRLTLANLWAKEDSLFDIIIQYSKMLGLYWDVDNQNKKIKLLTRYSYFKNYTVEDWSNKVDYSKDYKVTPILHASKYLNFNYDDIDDGYHYSDYQASYLTNYGGYRLKTGYEFTPDSEDIFKGLQPSCFSNRNVLMWKQIYKYNPVNGVRAHISPLTLLDSDSQDASSPLALNTWCFRKKSKSNFSKQLSKEDLENWNAFTDEDEACVYIVNATPTMIGADKYSYIDLNAKEHYKKLDCFEQITRMPNFCNADGNYGTLFAKPLEDYTIANSEDGTRGGETDIVKTKTWLYNKFWEKWMNERYNINNKKLTCYIKFTPEEFKNITPIGKNSSTYFANFKIIDNQLYMLNKIFDFNINQDCTAKCEFIQVTDLDAYIDETTVDFGEEFSIKHVDSNSVESIIINPDTRQYYPYDRDIFILGKWTPNRDYYYYLPYKSREKNQTTDYWDWDARIRRQSNEVQFKLLSSVDTTATVNVTENAMLLADWDNPDYTVDKKTYKLNGGREKNDGIFFKPFFTFFKPNDSDVRQTTVNAITDGGTNGSIYFNIKNVNSFFYFEGNPEIVMVDSIGNFSEGETYERMFTNNWGNMQFDKQYVSFYEIPLHIIQRTDIIESRDEFTHLDAYANLILPTNNKCVDDIGTIELSHNLFNHDYSEIYAGNELFYGTESFQKLINDLFRELRKVYPQAEIHISEKDGKRMPIRLYTTWIYGMKVNDGVTTENKALKNAYNFRKADDNVFTLGDVHTVNDTFTIYNTDDIYNPTVEYVTNKNVNDIKSDCYGNINNFGYSAVLRRYASYVDIAFETDIDWKRSIESDSEKVHCVFFGNNIGYDNLWYPNILPSKSVDALGRMSALDLVNHYTSEPPFLIDMDNISKKIDGNDGYIYQTFCQEIIEENPIRILDCYIEDENGMDISKNHCFLTNGSTVYITFKLENIDMEYLLDNSTINVKIVTSAGNVVSVTPTVYYDDYGRIVIEGLYNRTGIGWYVIVEININNCLETIVLNSPCSDDYTFRLDSILKPKP